MTSATIKELKLRFESIARRHYERWKASHPGAPEPTDEQKVRDIEAGKFSIDIKLLKERLQESDQFFLFQFFSVVIGESHADWLEANREWQAAHDAFRDELLAAKESYRDRALFDHESGFLMLRDFTKWRASTESRKDEFEE